MIAKELDPFESDDPLQRAGRKAEQQLAFYLRRDFAKYSDVVVFNGIRLERNGDAAQMDHLILHPCGFIIVESKSVTSRITFNAHGEWTRYNGNRRQGMPSPILQAQRQGDFLIEYFTSNNINIMKRTAFGNQAHVLGLMLAGREDAALRSLLEASRNPVKPDPVDVLVAISDSGSIGRPARGFDNVCKADQVPGHALSIIQASATRTTQKFTPDGINRLTTFILDHHRPLEPARSRHKEPETPDPLRSQVDDQPAGQHVCRHCKGRKLWIQSDKDGYYFVCHQCSGRSPASLKCKECGHTGIIRQEGRLFYADCPSCRRSSIFYEYPDETIEELPA